jgi:tetratricopeptide (TPR) repeat protein
VSLNRAPRAPAPRPLRPLVVAAALGAALLTSPGAALAQATVMPAIQQMPTHPELEAARALIEDERYADAFGKLARLLPTLAPDDSNRVEAQFELGRLLYGEKLYQSALRAFDAVLVPPTHPLFKAKLLYYLRIHRAVPADLATLERLSDAPDETLPREFIDEIRFLLGRYYYRTKAYEQALRQLAQIRPTAGETYLKARHLSGVLYVIKNEAQPALEAFKDVLRFESQVGSPAYYPRYRELAHMSLGRLFYSIGQFDTAVRYYDLIKEGTGLWLESLFELGWTYFRMGRIDRVLGQLRTLNSPYFEDRYYPEARVLEALILFRTCRFNETMVTVQRFLRDYKPLRKELDLQLGGDRSDAEFYYYLAELAAEKGKLSVQLRRIFNAALNDRRLQRMFTTVVRANAEADGLARLKRNTDATEAAQVLIDDLNRVRNVMIAEAGALARRRLATMREGLTEVIRQGLRIKYETLRARRNRIAQQLRRDMAETAAVVSEPRDRDPEHTVWAFDGSYWRDELGGYTYDVRSKCTDEQFGAFKPSAKGGPAPAGADATDGAADEGGTP